MGGGLICLQAGSVIEYFLILTDSVVDVRSPHREGKISVLVGCSATEQASSNNERHKMGEITTNGIKPQKTSELEYFNRSLKQRRT